MTLIEQYPHDETTKWYSGVEDWWALAFNGRFCCWLNAASTVYMKRIHCSLAAFGASALFSPTKLTFSRVPRAKKKVISEGHQYHYMNKNITSIAMADRKHMEIVSAHVSPTPACVPSNPMDVHTSSSPTYLTPCRCSSLTSIYIWCTLLFLVQVLNCFPQTQKITPQRHHSVIKHMFVMIGGTYPSSTIQVLMNFENP